MKVPCHRRTLAVIATTLVVTSAFAQRDFIGYHQYPQFRSMSGLPGSGFPVNQQGEGNSDGAMAISIPVAYSLHPGRFVIGGMTVSTDLSPRFFRSKGRDSVNGNGTAQVMGGVSLGRAGRLTVGGLLLSGRYDSVLNLHWMLPTPSLQKLSFAVGVQDAFGSGASSGTNQPGDGDSSSSLYGVATYAYDPETHFTLGVGDHRFTRPFGGVSRSLTPNVKITAEYDAFNINAQVGYLLTIGPSANHQQVTLAAGVIRGKYAAISANYSF